MLWDILQDQSIFYRFTSIGNRSEKLSELLFEERKKGSVGKQRSISAMFIPLFIYLFCKLIRLYYSSVRLWKIDRFLTTTDEKLFICNVLSKFLFSCLCHTDRSKMCHSEKWLKNSTFSFQISKTIISATVLEFRCNYTS